MIDLSRLMQQLADEEAEAQRALHAAQLRLANIRGQRRGLERTIQAINEQMQPVQTQGTLEAAAS